MKSSGQQSHLILKGPGFDPWSRCWLSQVCLGDHQAALHKFWHLTASRSSLPPSTSLSVQPSLTTFHL